MVEGRDEDNSIDPIHKPRARDIGDGDYYMDRLISAQELSNRLGVPVTWIYDRTRQGGPETIPHYKIGRYLRFREQEILDFLNARRKSDSN